MRKIINNFKKILSFKNNHYRYDSADSTNNITTNNNSISNNLVDNVEQLKKCFIQLSTSCIENLKFAIGKKL